MQSNTDGVGANPLPFYSSNCFGYSVVECGELTKTCNESVLNDLNLKMGREFESLATAAAHASNEHFDRFKNKKERMLTSCSVNRISELLEIKKYLNILAGDYVTDEEGWGFGNMYWRLVRANSANDVGPMHADAWFWNLGQWPFPDTHERVKMWLPLIQNDVEPSFKLVPCSHLEEFHYRSTLGVDDKLRPIFHEPEVEKKAIVAPVTVGNAIIFNDRLLHGGRATDSLRVSVEWTIAVRQR